jgi:hypothetical protein
MAWDHKQRAIYFTLVQKAWTKEGGDPSERAERETWAKDALEKLTGRRSTKDCNGGRHFERACAHFEALAMEGIQWQLRMQNGDRKRIRYAVKKISPACSATWPTDAALEAYAIGIVRKMFPGAPESLHLLSDAQIYDVTQAFRSYAHRFERNNASA